MHYSSHGCFYLTHSVLSRWTKKYICNSAPECPFKESWKVIVHKHQELYKHCNWIASRVTPRPCLPSLVNIHKHICELSYRQMDTHTQRQRQMLIIIPAPRLHNGTQVTSNYQLHHCLKFIHNLTQQLQQDAFSAWHGRASGTGTWPVKLPPTNSRSFLYENPM